MQAVRKNVAQSRTQSRKEEEFFFMLSLKILFLDMAKLLEMLSCENSNG